MKYPDINNFLSIDKMYKKINRTQLQHHTRLFWCFTIVLLQVHRHGFSLLPFILESSILSRIICKEGNNVNFKQLFSVWVHQ